MNVDVFPSPNELQATERNVKCSQEGCPKTFVHTGALNMHLVKAHGVVKTDQDRLLYSSIRGKKFSGGCVFQYFCPAERCIYKKESNKFFTTFKLLKQHYQKVHAEKVFKCEKCPAAFGLERELRRHVEHCGVLFKCGSCPVSYTTKETLQSHCNRQEHVFPEEYASKNNHKKKRSNRTTSSNDQDSKPVPVAILLVGLPAPAKNQPKLPKAILPKDIQNTIQGMKITQAQSVRIPSKETETPIRQNAVIQTEIYGVENLAVEGREHDSETSNLSGPGSDKNVTKPVYRLPKAKARTDKENSLVTRNKKSSTGMQTSVSLFPRKRHKTVTGTQTSGDYILKRAMASADIPIQRKTVASQVTPQKPGAKLSRKRVTCSSETQTGVSPEKQSKVDSSIDSVEGPVKNILVNVEPMKDNFDDSLSASTQTLQSYLESQKESTPAENVTDGNMALSIDENVKIKPLNEILYTNNIQNLSSGELSVKNVNICFQETGIASNFADGSRPQRKNSESFEIVKNSANMTASFIESLGLRPTIKQVTNYSAEKGIDHSFVHFTENSNKINKPEGYKNQISLEASGIKSNNDISQMKSAPGNTSEEPSKPKRKSDSHKGRKTIRNMLDISEKNKIRTSESTLQVLKPHISTTSGISFNSNVLTYSNVQNLPGIAMIPAKSSSLPSTHAVNKADTLGDYDSHKLFNPINDAMFSGKTNGNSNTTEMGAQAMSASEFEELLIANGLLFANNAQTANENSDFGNSKAETIYGATDMDAGNLETGFVHKEMETETLTGSDFDFLNESSTTIDMNTQTLTEFSSLLGDRYGPTDSDTQTVAAEIDFLDLVMTNMETQTLSDEDLIDLGLMDPDQASATALNDGIDDLRSSHTQTSFIAQQTEVGINNKNEQSTNVVGIMLETNTATKEIVNNSQPKQKLTQSLCDKMSDNVSLIQTRNYSSLADTEKSLSTSEPHLGPQSAQNAHSSNFQTTSMKTQTAFDDLQKLLSM